MEAALSQEATRHWLGPSGRRGPDERLSALAAAGDDRAFEVLYQRYSTPIYRYLRRRLSSDDEAQDVHQQVFLSAYSALRAGVEPVRFKAWLYRIAHNVCVSELRARKPIAVQIDEEHGLASTWADAAPKGREDLRELLDDLGNIPQSQSSALLLHEINDLSYAEIAETLHLPIATVRSHIFRARASLHALQTAREVDCADIRAELSRLAGRRGRRSAHVTNHLRVCTGCTDYRRRLRQRPALSVLPLLPVAWLRPLRALFGTSEAAGGLATAGAGGIAVGAKVAAITASVVAVSVGVYTAPSDDTPAGSGERGGAIPFQDAGNGAPGGSVGPSAPAIDRAGGGAVPLESPDGTRLPLTGTPGPFDRPGGRLPAELIDRATPPAQQAPVPVKPLDPPRTTQPPAPGAGQPQAGGPRAGAPGSGSSGSEKPAERGTPTTTTTQGSSPPAPTPQQTESRSGSSDGIGESSGSGSAEDRAEREAEEQAEEQEEAAEEQGEQSGDTQTDPAGEPPAAESGTEPATTPSEDPAGDAVTPPGESPGA